MADEILKGIYKEGPVVASAVVSEGKRAQLLVRGAEPAMAGDPGFVDRIQAIADGVRDALAKYEQRTFVVIFDQRPSLIDQMQVSPEIVEKMGFRFVGGMDWDLRFILRRCLSEPLGTPLAYHSLKGSAYGTIQPGRVDVPATFKRLPGRELSDPEKQVVSVAVQLSGDSLMKLALFEDDGRKMLAVLHDFPPARARGVLFSLNQLGEVAAKGDLPALAKSLDPMRGD